MIGNGDVKTGITDLRDVGRYVALIVNDERTLNRFVFSFSEVLSQKKVFGMLEKISGEKIVPNVVCILSPLLYIESGREMADGVLDICPTTRNQHLRFKSQATG
jgi:hypothetical protein